MIPTFRLSFSRDFCWSEICCVSCDLQIYLAPDPQTAVWFQGYASVFAVVNSDVYIRAVRQSYLDTLQNYFFHLQSLYEHCFFLIVHQRAPAVSTSASPTFTWEIDARSPQPNTIGNVTVIIIIISSSSSSYFLDPLVLYPNLGSWFIFTWADETIVYYTQDWKHWTWDCFWLIIWCFL